MKAGALTIKAPSDFSRTLVAMLSRFNIASHEFLTRQFDHEVQGGSVIKPVQGAGRVTGDAGVFRPLLSSSRAVVLSSGLAPYYANLDPYRMAAASLDTAIRNSIAAGASLEHLAILDNFCWASSDEPERLWQLKEAARACFDYATLYGTPFISGKDSMFNDFKGYDENGNFIKISALPTLLISTIGVIENAERAVSIDVKSAGDSVYLIGETHDELGGSEYARMHHEPDAGEVPLVDGAKNMKAYSAFERANEQGLIASAISVGRGGVAVALARTSMAGKLGVTADLSHVHGSAVHTESILFSESQGRILVTTTSSDAHAFEKTFAGVSIKKIGTVTDKQTLSIILPNGSAVHLTLEHALEAYRATFKDW